jgi:hypothetical protein
LRRRSITVCPLTRTPDIRERKLTWRQFHRRSLTATQLVHTHINLDGREVAKNTMKHTSKEGNKPAAGGRMPYNWMYGCKRASRIFLVLQPPAATIICLKAARGGSLSAVIASVRLAVPGSGDGTISLRLGTVRGEPSTPSIRPSPAVWGGSVDLPFNRRSARQWDDLSIHRACSCKHCPIGHLSAQARNIARTLTHRPSTELC